MTPHVPHSISRRTALKYAGAAVWSVGALLVMPTPPAGRVSAALPTSTTATVEDTPPAPRYRFDCITPVPGFAPLGRLEEVWASPRYMTFTDCIVSYVGAEPYVLTVEESAVVDVVANAGGDVSNREQTYLLVLSASTRIELSRLPDKLAELGRPIVEGSLALAPDAPQAMLFAEWLESTA